MKINEKGSVTVFIIIAILLFVFVLFSIFFVQGNKKTANDNSVDRIEKQYNKDLNNINEIYEEQLNQVNQTQTNQ